jgi:hypothetical protein
MTDPLPCFPPIINKKALYLLCTVRCDEMSIADFSLGTVLPEYFSK